MKGFNFRTLRLMWALFQIPLRGWPDVATKGSGRQAAGADGQMDRYSLMLCPDSLSSWGIYFQWMTEVRRFDTFQPHSRDCHQSTREAG
jgi:hypothetical protein